MENSKLIQRLRSFSREEFADFILFSESPYHNKNQIIVRLLKFLEKYHPDLRGSKIRKEYVYKKIYSAQEEYREKRMSNLMSTLFLLSEEFVGFDKFKKSPLAQAQYQLQAHKDGNRYSDFKKACNKIKKITESMSKDEVYHFAEFQLNKEIYLHPDTPRKATGMPSLPGLLEHLDNFYMREKMYFTILARNRMRVLNEEYEFSLLSDIREVCKNGKEELRFLYDCERMLLTDNRELLLDIGENFDEYAQNLSFKRQQNLYLLLTNVAFQLNRKRKYSLENTLFLLIQTGLKKKYVLDTDGKIHEDFFFSVCSSACNVAAYDWADEFIENYASSILQSDRIDTAKQLAKGIVFFERAQVNKSFIGKAIDYLLTIEHLSHVYKYRAKTMILRLYLAKYEAGEEDIYLLSDYVKAFERQLSREKTANEKFKASIKNLIRIVWLFAKLNAANSMISRQKIVEEYKQMKHIWARKWVERKIGEM